MSSNSRPIKGDDFAQIIKYEVRCSCAHDTIFKQRIVFLLNARQTHDVPYNGRSLTTELQGDVETGLVKF